MTVFHDLCRDLQEINQRISRLRTIWLFANDLLSRHKREDFITTTQTAFSTILGQVFTQDRIDRAAVSPTTLADLAPASHTSSSSVCRFLASANHTISIRIPRSSPDLEHPAKCSSSFHFYIVTQHSCRSPSADCGHLKWKSQMVLPTTPSGSQ